ncbi:MarR family winged helix-turn-helix transcriptional regulator [Streptomyces sp. NPDC001292]|uniref:MarR family winged helix-turn-helix transcriptional regulator n=1 Tax=Streptomyces sp. NPDC001292 TaxID=3364558 RepID=UPI003689632A
MTARNGRPAHGEASTGDAAHERTRPTGTEPGDDTVAVASTGDAAHERTRPTGTEPGDDTVAGVVRQWRAVHPDLDTAPMEIIGRINRCAALLQQAEDAPLRRAGLSRPEFDLLGALRRTGDELTPSELTRETFSSGAAVTKRLKQLTERGLVERRGDTRDRRVAHVRLTDAGRDLVDGILPEQLAYERAVLSGLARQERDGLAALLADLLGRLEGRPGALRL